MATLDDLAVKHGTDKSHLHHGYAEIYERYLGMPYVRSGSLLELGWGGHEDPTAGGESARMWREWLPSWTITIVDNEPKAESTVPDGITLVESDQTDAELLVPVAEAFGPFDVIIDDASHESSLTIASFSLLWEFVKPGGFYVVEDLHQSYHANFYGLDEANPDPDSGRAARGDRSTAMGFLRRLADDAMWVAEWSFPSEHLMFGEDEGLVDSVHFHRDIAFVQKRA